ncbi:MAG TPA: ABC transporter ATP-binding protein [Candidatus Kapabacteria bacterium]|nr:ABC transporter ATP-binding protein [Candidatus Kapabacteria bacterium]
MIIQANHISKSYSVSNKGNKPNLLPRSEVLKGLDLALDKGGFIAILGASGSGKSTLLHILGGLDKPDEGNVTIENNGQVIDLYTKNENELAHLRNTFFGFIFQFHHLLPEFTALENVMMPVLIKNSKSKEAKEIAEKLLEQVGLRDKFDSMPANLSGGEQQRVAIARALANNPKILLADEPTGNLDADNANKFMELLNKLHSDYAPTLIIATHSEEIASRAQTRYKLYDGKLWEI